MSVVEAHVAAATTKDALLLAQARASDLEAQLTVPTNLRIGFC